MTYLYSQRQVNKYFLTLLACKFDLAEQPKSWFLVNDITEKFEKLSAWLAAFFIILNDLYGLEGGRGCQPGSCKHQFGSESHHRREKVHEGHIKPLKSTLTTWIVDCPNFRTIKIVKMVLILKWSYWPKINFLVALPGQIYRL